MEKKLNFKEKYNFYKDKILKEIEIEKDRINNFEIDNDFKNAILYFLNNPGKLLRSVILLRSAEIYKIPDFICLNFAVALEFFQIFTLIHDDLPQLDNDNERRGIPTLHTKYNEATAILTGDALSIYTFNVFLRFIELLYPEKLKFKNKFLHLLNIDTDFKSKFNSNDIATFSSNFKFNNIFSLNSIFNIFSKFKKLKYKKYYLGILYFIYIFSDFLGIYLIDGQYKDINYKNRKISEDEILDIYGKKTGLFFALSFSFGSILRMKNFERVFNYGMKFGVLFQLYDDLIEYGENKSKKDELSYINILGYEKAKEKYFSLYSDILNFFSNYDIFYKEIIKNNFEFKNIT
jgi:geranylgeranyl pyrophosphate synthase